MTKKKKSKSSRKTKQQTKFGKAGKACANKGIRPGTKEFGRCVKNRLKN